MRPRTWLVFVGAAAACASLAVSGAEKTSTDGNLVQNPSFVKSGDDPKQPAHFAVKGDAEWVSIGGKYEFAPNGVAFYPWLDLDNDGKHAGSVSQDVTGFETGRGKWFRFAFRGLAEDNFAVADDGLRMRVDFYSRKGAELPRRRLAEALPARREGPRGAGGQRQVPQGRRSGLEDLRPRLHAAL